jgi:aspartyl-tRNA(Asn)/glutamyl-tRNA(Gln) amidotransferase subunit A
LSELCDLTAGELLNGYRSGSFAPIDVIESVIARIEALEPKLHATYAFEPDNARGVAKASLQRWRDGSARRLEGVPVSIKEMVATKGVPKPVGTAAGDMNPQPADAPPAARLREAGAIIVTKTTNPDYGMLSSGVSSFHPLSRNPWDLSRTPGGSSSGAGAAAAAGYGPLHLGTDIGGSLRLPASWCGIYSLKPSFGRIPIDPPFIGRVAGPMTRTVEDSALMMEVLSQPDARDYMSLPPAEIEWDKLDRRLAGLRVGLQMDAGCGLPVEPEVAASVENAAKLLADAGVHIEPVRPFMTQEMLDGLDRFWRTRFLAETRHLSPERYAKITPFIRAWIEAAPAYDGMSVYTGFNQIIRMRELGMRAFQGFDFIISPTAPIPAYGAEQAMPTDDPKRPFEHIGFTVPANMTEQPAASINCGYTSGGLPIGLQIVGDRFDDLGVLQFSREFERIRGPQRPWPINP